MKKLKLTRILSSALILVSALALSPIGASAEWRENSVGWWYAESNSWATGWRNIDGKWYYFDANGYMLHDTNIGGYQLGSDGAWVVTPPTASTTTTGDNAITISGNTTSTTVAKDIGFDEMELSPSSSGDARKYYNKHYWVPKNINELSIGGEDYLNTYKKGNIVGFRGIDGHYTDYVFNLNGNYSRFTAVAGVDDLLVDGCSKTMMKQSTGYIKMTIIADGVVLDTQNLYYGEKAKEIDVNIAKCNELRIRAELEFGSKDAFSTYYDILGGKFYHK